MILYKSGKFPEGKELIIDLDLFIFFVLKKIIKNYFSQKNPDLKVFLKTKPRNPDGTRKKQTWVEKSGLGALRRKDGQI